MKNKITNKAIDLFLRFGFKSVTMDDIAHELGISKKTIYTHFKTKTKLIETTTLLVFDSINSGITQICATNLDSILEMYKVKALVMEQLKNEETSPQYQLQKYYPKIFETLKQLQLESVNNCIANNLKKGIESGNYRKNIDIELVTRLYFNGIIGIKNAELFPIKSFSVSYLMDSYLEFYLRSIVTSKGLKKLEKIIKK